MDDLVVFLRARLAEEKAEAEKQPDDEDYGLKPWAVRWEETGEWNGYPYVRVAKARVLAEVEAKLGIVEDCENIIGGWNGESVKDFAMDMLRLLAAPYREHPDYKPEWAPSA